MQTIFLLCFMSKPNYTMHNFVKIINLMSDFKIVVLTRLVYLFKYHHVIIRVERRVFFFFNSGSTFEEQKWSIRKFWTSGKKTTATTACINEWINERQDFYINQSILNAFISVQCMTCQIQVNSLFYFFLIIYTSSAVIIQSVCIGKN